MLSRLELAVLGRRWDSEKKAREERGGLVRAGRGLGVVKQRWIRPEDTGKKAPVAQLRRERCWNHTGVWPRPARRPRRSQGDTGDTRQRAPYKRRWVRPTGRTNNKRKTTAVGTDCGALADTGLGPGREAPGGQQGGAAKEERHAVAGSLQAVYFALILGNAARAG
ncbi:hypothetical protein NDU88_003995 [Pleurodeles waltl]|uniref:Uncharacterized protein n=1 Tax=Pleurodeles waltl TaxID=8319 RepID=A0AAV7WQM9_PLEWA|nr:hypothetical protein NDU88_003995 [Pleurodeles waltl]